MAYIYQADVWCDTCADEIMEKIRKEHPEMVPEDPMDDRQFDSDDWPKGYLPEHEESDGPDNCAGCREFLRNQLTQEGYRYLQGILNEHGKELPEPAQEWADHYDFHYREECSKCGYDADECECTEPKIEMGWKSSEME